MEKEEYEVGDVGQDGVEEDNGGGRQLENKEENDWRR